MIVEDPGHSYVLEAIDNKPFANQKLDFIKRVGPNYPGNTNAHDGILTQEVLRVLIDRCKYMNNQGPCAETDLIITNLRNALFLFEVRAARCRGAVIDYTRIDVIEDIPSCTTCGHISCDRDRHNKPHWSEGIHPTARTFYESQDC